MKINPIIPLYVAIPVFILLILLVIIFTKGIKKFVRILMLLLLFVINIRIMVYSDVAYTYVTNLDVIFCVDNTLSMLANDYKERTRLEVAKEDIKYIVDKLPNSNYSVISYSNDNYTRIKTPLTKDKNSVESAVMTIKTINNNSIPTFTPNDSYITSFKEPLKEVLTSSTKKHGRVRIVFIIGDGEITNNKKVDKLNDISDLISGGAVLGYGTTTGGYMYVESYPGSGQFKPLEDIRSYGKNAVSKIDEDNLKNMASELGIDYVHMNNKTDIDEVLEKINTDLSKKDSTPVYSYVDTYFYVSAFLIALFAVELYLDRRELV